MFSAIFSFSMWGWPAPVPLRFNSWGMSSPFTLQECLPKDFVRQIPKWPNFCALEVQGSSSAGTPPYFSKNHFVVAVLKAASSHHITCQPFFLCRHRQCIQLGTFPIGSIVVHIMEKLHEFRKLLAELTTFLRKLFVEIYFVCFNTLLVL